MIRTKNKYKNRSYKTMKKDIPVQKNKRYPLVIQDLGHRGEGIGKIDGFTIFVEGAIPEDKIEVKIVKIKSHYAIGKLEKIITPSLYRRIPPCSIAEKCGGCQIQKIEYEKQLEYKTQLVKDNIKRIGKLEDVTIYPIIGMENPWNYRNKAQFPIGQDKGKPVLGFYAPKSHKIISTDQCFIQHPINHKIINIVKNFIEEFEISIYKEEHHKGLLRHLVTKVGFSTQEVMVILVVNGRELPYYETLVNKLKESIPNISSIYLNYNQKKTNTILGSENRLLYGKEYIIDYIGDIKFQISPLSFFQVNPIQTKILYKKALEYANLKGNEIVYDIYCGIGTISLFLAKKAKKVIGVESVEQAIQDAKKNARLNQIENTEFYTGKAEEIIEKLYEQEGQADVIVLDPPRKGCQSKVLDTIIQRKPERIVYVSCNPSTLARDLNYLESGGFKTVEIQPVDMFPHTPHVECVVLMSRVEN